jgi:hypothetical protein
MSRFASLATMTKGSGRKIVKAIATAACLTASERNAKTDDGTFFSGWVRQVEYRDFVQLTILQVLLDIRELIINKQKD